MGMCTPSFGVMPAPSFSSFFQIVRRIFVVPHPCGHFLTAKPPGKNNWFYCDWASLISPASMVETRPAPKSGYPCRPPTGATISEKATRGLLPLAFSHFKEKHRRGIHDGSLLAALRPSVLSAFVDRPARILLRSFCLAPAQRQHENPPFASSLGASSSPVRSSHNCSRKRFPSSL